MWIIKNANKKVIDDKNSTNICSTKSILTHRDRLNIKVVLINEVFCKYSIPTNFIPSISYFIKNYMMQWFSKSCEQFCEWIGTTKTIRRWYICQSYLLTKLLYIYKRWTSKSLQNTLLVSRKPTLNERRTGRDLKYKSRPEFLMIK